MIDRIILVKFGEQTTRIHAQLQEIVERFKALKQHLSSVVEVNFLGQQQGLPARATRPIRRQGRARSLRPESASPSGSSAHPRVWPGR